MDRSQPGSIILLHDGLDGDVHADRSVLLTALPLILDGLRAKGLEPVTLDGCSACPATSIAAEAGADRAAAIASPVATRAR